LKGGAVEPDIGLNILLYTYCYTFKISPKEAQYTPIELMAEMLKIHGEVKKIEHEEMQKQLK